MRHILSIKRALTCLAVIGIAVPAGASAETTVRFDETLRLARANAPELIAAQANIAVAEAQVQASDDWRVNPRLSVAGGPRFGDETSIGVMVGLQMPIVFGGSLESQISVASADQEVARAELQHQEQIATVAAARAFANTLYWQYRVQIATDNLQLVTEIESVAAARKAAGDSGALESSVAVLARHRAEANIARLEAARLDAAGRLRWVLGMDADTQLVVEGDLETLANRASSQAERADLALSKTKIAQAKASQALAGNAKIPELRVGAIGGVEESDPIVRATLAITLPIIWRGTSDIHVGEVRERAQTQQTQVLEQRVKHQIQVADQKVQILNATVQAFGSDGMPEARKAAEIANASYKAGAMPLPTLLVVRRELVAAEEQFAELLLLAALARIEALASTGAINNIISNTN